MNIHYDYHAMVLHGHEDEPFVEYMVTRMEEIGLRVFYPARDLGGEMIELGQIAERCKKVVAVISPSFCSSMQNLYDVDTSLYHYIRNRERILLPVIYTKQKFKMPANLESLWKLKYQPESTLVNFWEWLIKSFDDPRLFQGLTEELKKMDFPPDKEGDGQDGRRTTHIERTPILLKNRIKMIRFKSKISTSEV